ncbi:hypothetical protein HPC49_32270 [Pyxidicoccus fallax]|uniref:Uncharacterized protein n=1 Tax=Pyxidicoccus fallax TaxID=394095 RepID=A0A848LEQ2_9BACT|nr:hypothetical protein [Pyxidicoccus fallax]NMO16884.1 hypothetical protein [Pyxidicoccus fallax]NPC82888.1 hypothetical protein [Pyxidicoccus fallax]
MNQRTAAVTLAVLRVLSPRHKSYGLPLIRRRSTTRNLAFATLGSATLRLLRLRLAEYTRRARGLARLRARASSALREPVEATLAVAMLGALALPLLVEPAPAGAPERARGADKRSAYNGGENGGAIDFEAPIASW